MARSIQSISRGKSVEISGLPQLRARVKDIIDGLDPQARITAGRSIQTIVADAADDLYDEVVRNAGRAGLPGDAMDDIFSFRRPHPSRPRSELSALVGVAKRGKSIGGGGIQNGRNGVRKWRAKGYREWNAGRSWSGVAGGYLKKRVGKMLKKGLVTGRLVGESLATMWEIGTSKMDARPFFRPAVVSMRGKIVERIASGFRKWLEDFTQRAA